jgi:rod shape-determining protein MreD
MTGVRLLDRRRRGTRAGDRWRLGAVMAVLLMLEFYVRPAVIEGRGMPDFLMLVLLFLALRQSPGMAAVTGLVVGLIADVLTPARFGAAILAHVVVGWGAAWGRAIFFPDNLVVNAGVFFVGTWIRDVLVLLASGTPPGRLVVEALVWAPLQGLSTAVAGVILLVLFRDWLAIRIET